MRIFFPSVSCISIKNIKICGLNPEMQAKEHGGVPSIVESGDGHIVLYSRVNFIR